MSLSAHIIQFSLHIISKLFEKLLSSNTGTLNHWSSSLNHRCNWGRTRSEEVLHKDMPRWGPGIQQTMAPTPGIFVSRQLSQISPSYITNQHFRDKHGEDYSDIKKISVEVFLAKSPWVCCLSVVHRRHSTKQRSSHVSTFANDTFLLSTNPVSHKCTSNSSQNVTNWANSIHINQ